MKIVELPMNKVNIKFFSSSSGKEITCFDDEMPKQSFFEVNHPDVDKLNVRRVEFPILDYSLKAPLKDAIVKIYIAEEGIDFIK